MRARLVACLSTWSTTFKSSPKRRQACLFWLLCLGKVLGGSVAVKTRCRQECLVRLCRQTCGRASLLCEKSHRGDSPLHPLVTLCGRNVCRVSENSKSSVPRGMRGQQSDDQGKQAAIERTTPPLSLGSPSRIPRMHDGTNTAVKIQTEKRKKEEKNTCDRSAKAEIFSAA